MPLLVLGTLLIVRWSQPIRNLHAETPAARLREPRPRTPLAAEPMTTILETESTPFSGVIDWLDEDQTER